MKHRHAESALVRDSIVWDVANWSSCLDFWQRHSRALHYPGTALEVGASANGGLSLWMAAKGLNVVCSGLEQPSSVAEDIHVRYGVDRRIIYRTLDVLKMD